MKSVEGNVETVQPMKCEDSRQLWILGLSSLGMWITSLLLQCKQQANMEVHAGSRSATRPGWKPVLRRQFSLERTKHTPSKPDASFPTSHWTTLSLVSMAYVPQCLHVTGPKDDKQHNDRPREQPCVVKLPC